MKQKMNPSEELEEYHPEKEKMLLSDALDRVINTGVTISGDMTIGIADVDLIYVGLRVLLSSVDKLQEEKENNASSSV